MNKIIKWLGAIFSFIALIFLFVFRAMNGELKYRKEQEEKEALQKKKRAEDLKVVRKIKRENSSDSDGDIIDRMHKKGYFRD